MNGRGEGIFPGDASPIGLLTDFGVTDTYAEGSLHLAVVDPGVGSTRRAVAARTRRGDVLVGPDNGLLVPAIEQLGGLATAVELTEPAYWGPRCSGWAGAHACASSRPEAPSSAPLPTESPRAQLLRGGAMPMGTKPPRRKAPGWGRAHIYTVGHSTRSVEELVELLHAHGVRTLVDIRTVPRSRTTPQFNQDSLPRTLAREDLRYVHLPRLGGLRRARKDSPNGAWRNASFRGYADYMLTEDFARGLEELRELTEDGPLALMCAEAVRWRCHRSLVADALYARGVVALHISSRTRAEPHKLTPFAVLHGRQVLYPGEPEEARAEPPAPAP